MKQGCSSKHLEKLIFNIVYLFPSHGVRATLRRTADVTVRQRGKDGLFQRTNKNVSYFRKLQANSGDRQ
uniref:Uncharacterized protein n=1 Tax=Xiphophorus couchianus TaxID=32473 RepID=A0A3B5LI69_9TELE